MCRRSWKRQGRGLIVLPESLSVELSLRILPARQPFVIDFEAEPLAGTGLFAITGETGSGKSTILDALCLALYGRYPRFAETQQDTSPDPGGKVKILDGSTILRRGAGKGYAEVDFIGQDNLRYRVR